MNTPTTAKKRGRPIIHPCGTWQAAQRHYAHNEPPCDSCREAVNRHQQELYRLRQARRGLAVDTRPRKQPFTLHDVARLVRQRHDIENVLKIGPDVARVLIHACRQHGLL